MIFEPYPWLTDLVDPYVCTEEQITVYAERIFRYINVVTPSSTILYTATGDVLCRSSPGYDCVALYEMTEVIDSWSCDQTVAPNIVQPARSRTVFENHVSISARNFTIYPNPSKGVFFVNFSSVSTLEQTVRMLTVQGQVLQTRVIAASTAQFTLDVSQQITGVYFVQIVSSEGSQMQRVVIK